METKEIKLVTPKEITEVGEALAEITNAVAEALKDGWQPSTDIPAIVMAAIVKLGSAVDGLNKLGEEFSTAPVLATMGILAPVSESAQKLLDSLKTNA